MVRRVRAVGTVCAALAIVTASCTTRIESTTGPAAATASVTGSTVGNYGSSVTTAPPTSTRALDAADLEKLLPTAAEIGPGYVIDPSGGEDAGGASDQQWDQAMRDACPDLYELSSDFSQMFTVAYRRNPTTAGRSFLDIYERKVAVELSDGGDFVLTKDLLDRMIAAMNSCKVIRVTDADTGSEMSMEVRANPDTRFGDLGMVTKLDIEVSGPRLPRPVRLNGHVRMFQVGDTAVSITTVDGFDPKTLRTVAVDFLLPSRLAERLEGDIEDLHGN